MTNTEKPTAHAAYITAVLTDDAPRLDSHGDPVLVAESDIENPDFMWEADLIAEEDYRREEWRTLIGLYN